MLLTINIFKIVPIYDDVFKLKQNRGREVYYYVLWQNLINSHRQGINYPCRSFHLKISNYSSTPTYLNCNKCGLTEHMVRKYKSKHDFHFLILMHLRRNLSAFRGCDM